MNVADDEPGSSKPRRNPESPYLSDCSLDKEGLVYAINDASSSLREAIDLEGIVESFPDPGGEIEAERLSDRAIHIRETLDDIFPRTDGETWSLRITDVEREDALPDATISSSGIATALYKAAQNQGGALAIEDAIGAANEHGAASVLVDDDIEMSTAELESMPQRLKNMVMAVTETLDRVIPRNDGESWSIAVDLQAQTLIDNQ